MPDQSSAAREHALLQEITEPLSTLPDDAVPLTADADFPVTLRGYDRFAVDAYVQRMSQVMAELQSRSSPQAAIRRALERVGEEVSGILQRAHETAEQVTTQSRREAEERLEVAREEASRITAEAQVRLKDLDTDTDRIWAERDRIVADARDLARQLIELADVAAARFPPADDADGFGGPEDPAAFAEEEPAGSARAEGAVSFVPVEDALDETLPLGPGYANGHAPQIFDAEPASEEPQSGRPQSEEADPPPSA